MKQFLPLTFIMLLAAPSAWSNGEGLSIREQAQGTARIDEEYVDELEVRDAALERQSQTAKTRDKMEDNPRNPAMVESFEEVRKKQEAREGEAQGQDYDNPKVWK